jgi:hypothetical protein
MMSKILTHIAGGKVFGEEDEILQSLNDYVIHESTRMITVFKNGVLSFCETYTSD